MIGVVISSHPAICRAKTIDVDVAFMRMINRPSIGS
jgi:hypothetical protein